MVRARHKNLNGAALAAATNERLIAHIEKLAAPEEAVGHACITDYRNRLTAGGDEHPLHDLTRHLVGTFRVTETSIRKRMVDKWKDDSSKVEGSVTNSLRRSAGTNYQNLVSYAIARHLLRMKSHWYVVHPVPKDWAYMLAIKFAGGVDSPSDEGTEGFEAADLAEADASVSVKPDLDILIRNASWDGQGDEPILVLSVKTSLADRAGAAARWKTYFDLVTRPCVHSGEQTCAYRRLGITLENAPKVAITHGIVTANIYKINSDPYFEQFGELRSNQSRANTFMFDVRYTTREESPDVMAEGWASLTELADWLHATSVNFGLPE